MRLFTNTAPPTRLAGAITSGATTITVDSTDGWPTPTGADVALGCLTYPNADTLELFTYTGKTSTTFTGVVRGVDDTDPKAHLNRALVVHVASWTDLGADSAAEVTVDDAAFTVLTGTDVQGALDSTDDYLAALVAAGVPVDDALFTRITGTDVQATLDSVDDYLAAHPDVFSNYIYNSSGAQNLNRFNDWADMMAAIGAVEGAKIITFEQDETIPAGAWNFNDCTLRGNGQEYTVGGFTLTFPTGCTISSWRLARIESIRLLSTSNAAVMTWAANQIFTIAAVSHVHSTTVPFFLGTAGTQHIFVLTDSGRFQKLGGGVENYDNTAPAFATQLIISRQDNSSIHNDTLKSTNAVIYVDIVADPANDLTASPWPQTHTNLNVGVSVPMMFPRAGSTSFAPAGSIAATTVQAAIEELDTDLTTLSGSVESGFAAQNATGVTNVAAIADVGATRFIRVGDVVTAYGKVSVDPTTAGVLTEWTIDLPIAESIVNDNQGSGMAVSDRAGEPAAYARSDATTDAMFFSVTPTSASVHLYSYQFSYAIV